MMLCIMSICYSVGIYDVFDIAKALQEVVWYVYLQQVVYLNTMEYELSIEQ